MGDSAVDAHERLELGLYVLGAVGAREREPIERHLAVCVECRSEVDSLVEVVAALALFSAAERRRMVQEFGVPSGTAARAASWRRAPTRTAVARPETMPGTRRPRPARRVRGLVGVAGAAVAIVVVSIVVGVTMNGQDSRPPDLAPAATAVDARTGASVVVRLTDHADGTVGIRATVTGLRDGTRYKLYAVTSAGEDRLVTQWTGAASTQDVTGDLPVSTKDLSFFTITLADDTPVVSAYLPRAVNPSPTG